MLCGILETVNTRAFKHLALCSAPLKTSMNEGKSLSTPKTCVLENVIEEFQKWWGLELPNLYHCFAENVLVAYLELKEGK